MVATSTATLNTRTSKSGAQRVQVGCLSRSLLRWARPREHRFAVPAEVVTRSLARPPRRLLDLARVDCGIVWREGWQWRATTRRKRARMRTIG